MKAFSILLLLGALCSTACTKHAVSPPARATDTPTPVSSGSTSSLPKIVAFGDSLTAGLGLSEAESYPALLQQQLEKDGYKYQVVNAGVSGDTSAGGLRRIDWSLDSDEGEVRFLILELGANDFLRGQPIAETKKNLAAIIQKAKSRGVKVLLAGMTAETSSGSEYRREIGEIYQSLAKSYDLALIPFILERVGGISSLNQADGIHPNAQGERIMVDNVYKYLKPMLDAEKGR